MLLETLDILKNDVVIYSENKFDFRENFKIIFKDEIVKKPQSIDYFEVCKFVQHPAPKNIIVYRLLTSVNNLDAYSTKYGFFINLKEKKELVYFDPVFAIRDLKHLNLNVNPHQFRFKIQQAGFTTIAVRDDQSVYSEVYSFDLRAVEAQNQNDKIFAQAIFALDDTFIDADEDVNVIIYKNDSVVEDDQSGEKSFNKPQLDGSRYKTNTDLNKNNIEKLKMTFAGNMDAGQRVFERFQKKMNPGEKISGKKSFSEFIKQHKESGEQVFFQNAKDFKERGSVILRLKQTTD
ncbi:MAG: hypothetical protein JW995_03870 [Melioribacteraceae bacterium]|nr:hypothetical protein [Melioribacteraceae bacterium]